MRRIAITAAGLIVLVLVATQLLLPRYLDRRVERQLTEHGGSAQVTLSAFPALRLLAREGDRLRVRASGLQLALVAPTSQVLGNLDGFSSVDVVLSDVQSGPFAVSRAQIERSGNGGYLMSVRATATAGALSTYAGGALGGDLGSELGGLASGLLGLGSAPIPINLAARIVSDGGSPVVEGVQGTIAGLPAGPVIEALAAALANRL